MIYEFKMFLLIIKIVVGVFVNDECVKSDSWFECYVNIILE